MQTTDEHQVMDKFEQQFEDLDVQGQYVENSMNQTTALSTPQEEVRLPLAFRPSSHPPQVDQLIGQVADEYGLQLSEKMGPIGAPSAKVQQKEEQDELFARLNSLKAT